MTRNQTQPVTITTNWRYSRALKWEKKEDKIYVAIFQATSTTLSGDTLTQWVAIRLDGRSGLYRIDLKDWPYSQPWRAIDGVVVEGGVRTVREAKQLVRAALRG